MLSSLAWLFQAAPLFHMRTPIACAFIRRASSTIPRMQAPFSGEFRMLAALRSPLSISAHCAAFRRSRFSCQRAMFGEPNAYVNQCKQIRSPIATPPFLLEFSHIQHFFTWSIQRKTSAPARCHIATNFGVWNNAQRVTRTRHAPTRRTPAHTSARQRANAHAPTHAHTRAPTHERTHASRTHAHACTHARGPPADPLDANREPSALLRALQVQCNRRVCIRVWRGASDAKRGVTNQKRITQGTR